MDHYKVPLENSLNEFPLRLIVSIWFSLSASLFYIISCSSCNCVIVNGRSYISISSASFWGLIRDCGRRYWHIYVSFFFFSRYNYQVWALYAAAERVAEKCHQSQSRAEGFSQQWLAEPTAINEFSQWECSNSTGEQCGGVESRSIFHLPLQSTHS